MEIIFWSCVILILYAYVGYPLLLYVLSKFKTKELYFKTNPKLPYVTLIISAANESKERILAKIENTKAIEYPDDLFEVIFAFDNPPVGSVEVVIDNAPNWKIVRSLIQLGKEQMQRKAVVQAEKTEVFVFTDLTSKLNPNVIYKLVKNFDEILVGAVDGKSVLVTEDGAVSSEGLYLKYENAIRKLESKCNSLVTTGGCLFAATREVVYKIFSKETQSDFGAALASETLGFRTVLDEEAVAMFPDLKDTTKEFSRKRRTILRGMNTLFSYKELLKPSHGFFAFQLWSHKILKWYVPCLLIALLSCNLVLLNNGIIYVVAFILQALLYSLGIYGMISKSQRSFVKIPTFFLSSNVAAFLAMISFLNGETASSWTVSVR